MITHKTALLILFSIFSLKHLSAEDCQAASILENVKWLIGTWEIKTNNGVIYESWKMKNSDELSGKSYTIKGSDTIVLEKIILKERNGKIYFTPSVTDQNDGNAIDFESVYISRSKFIVENRKHDFPNMISYTRIGQDELVAEISGQSKNGHISYQTFPMKRKPDTVSKNIDLVKNIFENFNNHEWALMASKYANPAEFKDPAFGMETVIQSHEQIITKYRQMKNMSTDIHDEIVRIYPSNESFIIVEYISSGTASNGKRWRLPLVTIFTIENNLIVKEHTYYDK